MIIMHPWMFMAAIMAVFANLLAAGPENAAEAAGGGGDPSFSAVRNVMKPLSGASDELDNLQTQLQQAASEEAKQQIQERIDAERERIRKLRESFREAVGGAEAADYEVSETAERTLQEQFRDLLQPLLGFWRDATSSPRELEQLRASLAVWEERKRKGDVILERIDRFSEWTEDQAMRSEFDSTRKFWEGLQAKAVGQIGVLKARIQEREQNRKPLLEAVSDSLSRFFKTRGLNLVMAIVVGVLGFVLTRRIYDSFRKISPVHRKGNTLASRISDIIAVLTALMVAVLGVLVVFYIRGDWLLLTLVVVLLLGAVWAGKASLPPYIEQVRTLLNLGSIREGERVVHLGLPWKVESIGFLTTLKNPNLQGGDLRIPIRHVMGMMSRQPDAKEPWFPTEVDDWVLMSDGTYGKVVTQTPEQVVVLRLGGSLKTYPAVDFLAATPENLSNGFRVACVFGIDYMHQAVSTTEVPELLGRALTSSLISTFGRDDVRSIKAEFLSAGASSLDYQLLVDVSGNLASRYQSLQRVIQKICVDASNEHGWVIPFTQITVHQAQDAVVEVAMEKAP